MSWYMCKYIGKSINASEQKRKFRTFAISEEARRESQPLMYEAELHHMYNNTLSRTFDLSEDNYHYGTENIPHTFNPYSYSWKWTGHGQTYSGFPKNNRSNSQRNAVNAEK